MKYFYYTVPRSVGYNPAPGRGFHSTKLGTEFWKQTSQPWENTKEGWVYEGVGNLGLNAIFDRVRIYE